MAVEESRDSLTAIESSCSSTTTTLKYQSWKMKFYSWCQKGKTGVSSSFGNECNVHKYTPSPQSAKSLQSGYSSTAVDLF